MEIRGIRDLQDVQLLLDLVKAEMQDVASGETVYGGRETQTEMLEQLNGIANALQEVLDNGHSTDIGWKMVD